MKVTSLPDVERGARSVAVGTFDGVHLGHREVIDGSDSVLTFEPHPVSVVAPQHTPKLLTTPERKAASRMFSEGSEENSRPDGQTDTLNAIKFRHAN